eukprot:4721336-Pleurochrysis_carterae.AAC.2
MKDAKVTKAGAIRNSRFVRAERESGDSKGRKRWGSSEPQICSTFHLTSKRVAFVFSSSNDRRRHVTNCAHATVDHVIILCDCERSSGFVRCACCAREISTSPTASICTTPLLT